MILNALDGRPLPIYGDGGNVRDWLHVDDHCAGLLLVLREGRPGEKYNIGGGNERTNLEVVDRHLRRARGAAAGGANPRCRARELSRAQDVRARSAGPRPALRDRRDEDPPRARLGAASHVRGRPARDRAAGISSIATGARPCRRAATIASELGSDERLSRDRHRSMKGIILAGGSGSRLHPLTRAVSKQLLPIYNKPMVYYPLSTLMLAGIRDDPGHHDAARAGRLPAAARRRLGDRPADRVRGAAEPGRPRAGVHHRPRVRRRRPRRARARRQHLLRRALLRLPADAPPRARSGATVFGYQVRDPERYGVVEFDADGRAVSLEEKPAKPKSSLRRHRPVLLRQPGRRHRRAPRSRRRAASSRSPTSIARTSSAASCTSRSSARGIAWLDTGTHESLMQASNYIQAIEERQGLMVACLEEIAFRMGYITRRRPRAAGRRAMASSAYGQYLLRVARAGGLSVRFVPTDASRRPRHRAGRPPRRPRVLSRDLSRREVPRRPASPARSCRTTTRARSAARCAACTCSSGGRRAS